MVEYDLKDISSEMKTVAERRFTFRSGAVTSGRIDMNGRTSSRKRTTQNFMSKFFCFQIRCCLQPAILEDQRWGCWLSLGR